jgi:hypothetical protein
MGSGKEFIFIWGEWEVHLNTNVAKIAKEMEVKII